MLIDRDAINIKTLTTVPIVPPSRLANNTSNIAFAIVKVQYSDLKDFPEKSKILFQPFK